MSDAQRRALRSFIQVGFVQACIQLYQAFAYGNARLTVEQVTAITLFVTPIIAFVQNWFEDNTDMPAILKAPANSGQNPQPDDGGKP